MMQYVLLTGEIYFQEGMYISHCKQLDIETCGKTLDEARERTIDMIRLYFEACQKQGTFAEVIASLRQKRPGRPGMLAALFARLVGRERALQKGAKHRIPGERLLKTFQIPGQRHTAATIENVQINTEFLLQSKIPLRAVARA